MFVYNLSYGLFSALYWQKIIIALRVMFEI
ncbi:hypothetical protein SAMN05660772_01628 [Pasteurella testudinis DSM 23072]|uniref:Uncharacterized protein n=1 Tax=Pasteurella testudinis DSM 23072 TaxID=1122938 RepID=A0A1W1UHZ8_9PAST|nr:hypothetical protein SAMN05660772_01628 [Pasteurella testudinis DSM 23072]SUB51897.1 Uncharacterised protein [Pasteurella testudinis]